MDVQIYRWMDGSNAICSDQCHSREGGRVKKVHYCIMLKFVL